MERGVEIQSRADGSADGPQGGDLRRLALKDILSYVGHRYGDMIPCHFHRGVSAARPPAGDVRGEVEVFRLRVRPFLEAAPAAGYSCSSGTGFVGPTSFSPLRAS